MNSIWTETEKTVHFAPLTEKKSTTAKITLGHGLIYDKMIRRFGEDKAQLYAEAQARAIEEYAQLCEHIDCDCEARDNYVYCLHDREKIEKEIAALNRIGIKAEFSDAVELPIKVAGAVCVKHQAQFHPLKFLYAIAQDLSIYEHTKIVELMPGKVRTNHGEITYSNTGLHDAGRNSLYRAVFKIHTRRICINRL